MDFLKALLDAPVMNVFIVVAAILIVFAAAGRVIGLPKQNPSLDTGGRLLCGGCGVVMLGAALVMFLGLRKAGAEPATDVTPTQGGKLEAAPTPTPALQPAEQPPAPPPPAAPPGSASLDKKTRMKAEISRTVPAPVPAIAPPVPVSMMMATKAREKKTLTSEEKYVDWGCAETKVGSVSLTLPPDAELVSAEVLVTGIDKAKTYSRSQPSLDSSRRVISGEVTFQGLDRIFFNCPGGGHARISLKAEVTTP